MYDSFAEPLQVGRRRLQPIQQDQHASLAAAEQGLLKATQASGYTT